jgi:hypothetical protein
MDKAFLAIAIVVTVIVVGLTFFAAVAIQATPEASTKEGAAPAPKDTPAETVKAAPAETPKASATPKDQAAPKDQPAPKAPATPKESPAPGAGGEKPAGRAGGLVPLAIQLPKPLFEGTPKNIKPAPTLEKPSVRPPFMVPEGLTNLALGKPVTSSDSEPIIGDLAMVTDGDKSGSDGSFVELGPGKQHVQIDLQQPALIYAIVIWHYHGEGRVYHDVIVQVADDADFIQGVRTLYNNDFDNSSGLGLGKGLEYMDDYRGRLIDAKGVKARYVRVYSNGNTSNDQNHYVEVEVYGKAPK